MRSKYRAYLFSGVASAALVMASSGAFAQTVTQSATNSASVSNPLSGTATITFGSSGLGTSLGIGASASISATGAATSTSVVGLNSGFNSPSAGFGTVSQDPFNSGAIFNNGSITSGTAGTAASGSSVSVGATGSVASFSILGVGAIGFTAVPVVGDIRQGQTGGPGAPSGINGGPVTNTGQITAPLLDLSGTGAAASVSAMGSQGTVSVGALGATSFSATSFGNITQTIANVGNVGTTVTNNVGGLWIADLSGNGASASATATGAAASVSFSYVDTTAWSASSVGNISQSVSNVAVISNTATANGGIQLGNVNGAGDISGVGASVHAGATGSIAALLLSSMTSGGSGTPTWASGQPLIQSSTNSGSVSNIAVVSAGGLTGVGSSASITATGAGATIAVASVSDTSNPTLTVGNSIVQSVTQNQAAVSNNGLLTLGGGFAAGATASVSAVGAQAAVSVSSINSDSFNTPTFGNISQIVNNGAVGAGGNVTNTLLGGSQNPAVSVGDLTGNGASVSIAATGAVASISYAFVNTTAWSATLNGGITQSVNNNSTVTNTADSGISVGNIGGVGASVVAGATGSLAALSITSINSGPPVPAALLVGYTAPQVLQTSLNTAPVINSASIVSSGTVAGIGSSIAINATGAGASFSVASIADTGAPATTLIPVITQVATNAGPTVQNTGSISLASGPMGAGSAAAISAVGASASISFLAVK